MIFEYKKEKMNKTEYKIYPINSSVTGLTREETGEWKVTLSKKAEGTKDRIINSAKQLFAENGFLKTTVADICRQAGLSEAALYEYFKGKEDLLLAIPDLWVSQLLIDLKTRCSESVELSIN